MRLAGAKSFMVSFPVSNDPNKLSPSGRDFIRSGFLAVASFKTSAAVIWPLLAFSTSIAQRAGT